MPNNRPVLTMFHVERVENPALSGFFFVRTMTNDNDRQRAGGVVMDLIIARLWSGVDSSVGFLAIDNKPFCFTCEDEHRDEKVASETRIPAGRYEIKLRDAGGMVQRYKNRFSWHGGMLHLQNVPGFEFIYIHVGNDEGDTSGCILVGMGADLNSNGGGTISRSVDAYTALYKAVSAALSRGEQVFAEILTDEGEQGSLVA